MTSVSCQLSNLQLQKRLQIYTYTINHTLCDVRNICKNSVSKLEISNNIDLWHRNWQVFICAVTTTEIAC
jgi:hypothetical protein